MLIRLFYFLKQLNNDKQYPTPYYHGWLVSVSLLFTVDSQLHKRCTNVHVVFVNFVRLEVDPLTSGNSQSELHVRCTLETPKS